MRGFIIACMLGVVLGNYTFAQPLFDASGVADNVHIYVHGPGLDPPPAASPDLLAVVEPLKRVFAELVGWLYQTSEPEPYSVQTP